MTQIISLDHLANPSTLFDGETYLQQSHRLLDLQPLAFATFLVLRLLSLLVVLNPLYEMRRVVLVCSQVGDDDEVVVSY